MVKTLSNIALNIIIIGLPAQYFITTYVFTQQEALPVESYFEYEYIEPAQEVFKIWDPVFFISKSERYEKINLNYNDTLFCWFSKDNLFWYSQAEWETIGALAGTFTTKWKYEWDTPTIPLVCQLTSKPFVKLNNGNTSEAQTIYSSFFTIE